MNLETWIGLRYLRAKKRNGFMSFISVISIVGIALGVMTLIVVLSVMNGFQKDVRAKLFEIAPHVTAGFNDENDERKWEHIATLAQQNKHIVAATPFASGQVLITNAGEVRGAMLNGIQPDSYAKTVDIKGLDQESLNKLQASEFNIILGSELAGLMMVNVGDKITILTPEGNATPAGMVPRIKQFNVVSIVNSDIYELNATLALIHIKDAQTLFRMHDKVSGVQFKLDNPQNAPEMLHTIIPNAYEQGIWVRDWSFQNQSYFEAVAMEKRMMFIIMALISLVASFNLVSSLVMTVNEKRSDIAILRTLGLSPAKIMNIFMIQGSISGFLGTLIGVISGVLIAMNVSEIVSGIEKMMGRSLVNGQIYFLNYIPSDIQAADVIIIAVISLLLAFLATLYPAWSAAKTQPAKALRYE